MKRHTEAVEATITAAGMPSPTKIWPSVNWSAPWHNSAARPAGGTRLAGTYLTAVRTLHAVIAAAPATAVKPPNGLAAVRGMHETAAKPRVPKRGTSFGLGGFGRKIRATGPQDETRKAKRSSRMGWRPSARTRRRREAGDNLEHLTGELFDEAVYEKSLEDDGVFDAAIEKYQDGRRALY
jgi:hypothetical protein